MRRISECSLLFAAAVAAGSVIAASLPASASEPAADRYGPAIGLGIGTLGIVGEASFKASSQFVVRVNGNWGQLDFDETVDANDYSGSAKIWGAGLIADWHPFAGSFRLSGGVRYHVSQFEGSVSGEDIEVDGNVYTAAEYGRLVASVENGNRVAPYLGFGWDSAHTGGSGMSLSLDLGVLYIGDTKASLTTTNTVPGLQDDLDAEVNDIKDKYGRFGQFWPVVSVAAKYTF